MVAGIGRRIAMMAALSVVGGFPAGPPPFDRPTPRRWWEGLPHDEHVRDWEFYQRQEHKRQEREARRQAQLERDRHAIEAAEEKRARKNAKRARLAAR